MNDTLYKMLEPTKTIEQALPEIIEAFVTFYGEEDRNYIENKFKNLIIIGYGLVNKLNEIINKIKDEKTEELIDKFFEKTHMSENKEKLKNILFSNYCFDHLPLIPFQKYIDFLEIEKDNPNYEYYKEEVLKFLKHINRNVTLENMESLQQNGAFDDIIKIIPIYKNIINEYRIEIKKLDKYVKEVNDNNELKKNLENKYMIQLLDEFSQLFSKNEIDDIKNHFEKYQSIFISMDSTIYSYIGNNLHFTPLVSAFSKESDEILLKGENWEKESVIRDRIKFFNNMRINLGSDYELYNNSEKCKSLIPQHEIIEKIITRKKELNTPMLNQFYKSTDEYQINRKKIDSYNLLIKDDGFNVNSYTNDSSFINPNVILKNEEYFLFPIMCINVGCVTGYLDVVTIHELNHVFELNLADVNENEISFVCGWDKAKVPLDSQKKEIEELEKRYKKREYELFSEIINQMIAIEITEILHNKGHYIFNNQSNTRIKNGTSHESLSFLVEEFYQSYKKEIMKTRKTGNMKPLFDKVGKENFELLNSLIYEYYENFGGTKKYSLYKDMKENLDTELTQKFNKLIKVKNDILLAMSEYSLEHVKGNQK